MGCSSSMYAGPTARARRRLEKTVVQIETPIDWDAPCDRQVKEFPMYSTRLKSIDYASIIRAGEDWKDENFPTAQSSLLESDIRKASRHQRWETFSWKRP